MVSHYDVFLMLQFLENRDIYVYMHTQVLVCVILRPAFVLLFILNKCF